MISSSGASDIGVPVGIKVLRKYSPCLSRLIIVIHVIIGMLLDRVIVKYEVIV